VASPVAEVLVDVSLENITATVACLTTFFRAVFNNLVLSLIDFVLALFAAHQASVDYHRGMDS